MDPIIGAAGASSAFGGAACNKIELLEWNPAHTFGDIVQGRHLAALTPGAGLEWGTLHTAKNSIQFTEKPARGSGNLYEAELKFRVPLDSPDRVNSLYRLGRSRWLVRWIDQNGQGKMIGTTHGGAQFILVNRDNRNTRTQDNQLEGVFRFCGPQPVAAYPFESEIFGGDCCAADLPTSTGPGECADATVTRLNGANESEAWLTIPAGENEEVPAVSVMQQDGGQSGTIAAGKPIVIRYDPDEAATGQVVEIESIAESAVLAIVNITPPDPCPDPIVPAGEVIPQYQLSQYAQSHPGDEGWQVQNGIWNRVPPTNPASVRRLDFLSADPFNTLAAPNQFGHTTRFTDKDGNALTSGNGVQTPADFLVIDTLYNAMWYVDKIPSVGDWAADLLAALNSTVGGFSNWVVPCRSQYETLWNHNEAESWEAPGFATGYKASHGCATRINASTYWFSHSNQDHQWLERAQTSGMSTLLIRPI